MAQRPPFHAATSGGPLERSVGKTNAGAACLAPRLTHDRSGTLAGMSDSSPPSDSDDVLGADGPGNTTEKDTQQWVTGDEPMTGAQRSYLDTLARDAGETLDANLTKAEASQHIERLQEKTGRGQG